MQTTTLTMTMKGGIPGEDLLKEMLLTNHGSGVQATMR